MARNKISLQGDMFEAYIARLDKLGGTDAMRRGTEKALKESKEYVTSEIDKAMMRLPAGGKYSTGRTKASIDRDMTVIWNGLVGEIEVGFDLTKSGLTSIFLMYGTPKMDPVVGLKNAIYGNKTKKNIANIQSEALEKVIKEIMEG